MAKHFDLSKILNDERPTIKIGKTAVKELNDLSLSMSAYKEIFYTLIACVNDEEISEVKKRFQK